MDDIEKMKEIIGSKKFKAQQEELRKKVVLLNKWRAGQNLKPLRAAAWTPNMLDFKH